MTENSEFSTDSFRSLTHTGQPPVPFAAGLQYLEVNPAAVVADENTQLTGLIFEFNLNPAGSGVPEGIHQGFSPNGIKFIAD